MALSFSTTLRNNRLDQIAALIGNAGVLRIYDATGGVPANVGTALGAQVLLGECVCGTPFAPAASAAALTANTINQDAAANNTGTAAFFRVFTSGGTAVYQGTCGTSGADLNLNTLSLVSGGPIGITSLVINEANA